MKIKLIILLLIVSSSVYAKKRKQKPKYLLGHSVFAEFNSVYTNSYLMFYGYSKTDSMGKRIECAIGIPSSFDSYHTHQKNRFNSGIDLGYHFSPYKLSKRSSIGFKFKSLLVYKRTQERLDYILDHDSLYLFDFSKVSRIRLGIMPKVAWTKHLTDQFYFECMAGYQYNFEHLKYYDVKSVFKYPTLPNNSNEHHQLKRGWNHYHGLFLSIKLIYNLNPSDKICK